MHLFISDIHNIKIDLSNVNITTNEENNWFSENFFVKYSYPFEISITPELNAALGDILSNNSSFKTIIEGQYYFYDKIEKATLIISGIEGNTATFELKYGYDEFPNFDKKLQDIKFETYTVDDIYYYANTIIHQKYPQTIVQFPQIVTEKYRKEDDLWKFFEGRLNNRKDGLFIKNTISEDDRMMNLNIIHPCVYLKHAIIKGFSEVGFMVEGDFLSNELINNILLFSPKDLYTKRELDQSLKIEIMSTDEPVWKSDFKGTHDAHWTKTISIPLKGKYNIIGQIEIEGVVLNGRPGGYGIKHNSTYIKQQRIGGEKRFFFIDLEIIVNNNNETVTVDLTSVYTPGREEIFANIQILPIYYINDDGSKESGIINSNVIDVARSLPDITFGQLVTTVSNLFNLDLSVKGNIVTLNYKVDSIYDNTVHDFRKFEQVYPVINFKSDQKFLLEYEENDEEKLYDKVYIDNKGAKIIKPKESISEIENTISINASPLLYDTNTVKAHSESTDSLNLIIYRGLINENNYADVPTPLLLPNIHEYYHRDWLEFRIQAKNYTPTFVCQIEDILKVSIKDRIFMYNNYHLIQNISRQQKSKDLFEIELSTETLKV